MSTNWFSNIDGIKYVICGYPEKKMKEIILNFWQENVDTSNETDIFFYNELKGLHNFCKPFNMQRKI